MTPSESSATKGSFPGFPDPSLSDKYRLSRVFTYTILAMALVFAMFGAFRRSGADPAFSRLATVYSLVHHGTFYLDRPLDEPPNYFEQRTIDKVMVRGERIGHGVKNGRIISSKPPMLPLLMTAEYAVMRAVFGWDLDRKEDIDRILFWMTTTIVGGAYVLTLLFFTKTLRLFVEDPLILVILLYSLAFCTQLWGYSTLLNNHVPGACALVIMLYHALGVAAGKLTAQPWRFFVAGLCAALVFTLDMPATVFAAAAGLILLARFPKQTVLWAGLGAVPPLLIHFGVMYSVTGSLLPVQSRPELYRFESSYWRHPIQVDALNEPKLTYLFHMTWGRCGIFSLYPVLFVGLLAGLKAVPNKRFPYRTATLAGLAAFVVMTTYYMLKTNNYGGEAYGFRWYIPAMPVLLLMGAPILQSLRKRWQWIFVSFMIALSFYSAWECTRTGWAANQEWTCRFLGRSY